MKLGKSSTRVLLLAGGLGALAAASWPAAAQQQPAGAPPAAAPAPAAAPPAGTPPGRAGPPGSALFDRPDHEGAKKLAPVAPPPVPLTADKFQLDKLKLPKGFKIEVYA